ncbi:MAG: hypothetical protein WDN69_14215 [Aliidongia sp.]
MVMVGSVASAVVSAPGSTPAKTRQPRRESFLRQHQALAHDRASNESRLHLALPPRAVSPGSQ